MKKVFIDGSAGTTGLQIFDRLKNRTDIALMPVDESRRKELQYRKECINNADIVFLCLPDAAAVESVSLVENPDTCIIDTSTAHRTNPEWTYGFPEITGFDKIAVSKKIANPGCHATGFISVVYPLVKCGIINSDADLSCFSLTGYSGGGKKMIAEYEDAEADKALTSAGIYGLAQNHKHLPEMKTICGLSKEPVFCPIVDNYYKGMSTTIPLFGNGFTLSQVREAFQEFYKGQQFINVLSAEETDALSKIYSNTKSGTDSLDIIVTGNDERMTVTALFDNLGKGASGSAIENMNIVMGINPAASLVL